MILWFQLYSMLAKYRILELVKHLSFALLLSFYPEVHRPLLVHRLIHPWFVIVFKFGTHACGVRVCVVRCAVFWEKSKLFIKFSKEYIAQSQWPICVTTSFYRLVNGHIHILNDFSQEHGFLVALKDSVLLHSDISLVTKGLISLPCMRSLLADGSWPSALFRNCLAWRKLPFPRSHPLP